MLMKSNAKTLVENPLHNNFFYYIQLNYKTTVFPGLKLSSLQISGKTTLLTMFKES